jgi:hypothetical protein
MPDTPAPDAGFVLDRLRDGLGPDVTCGVAGHPHDGDDVVSLLHAAEERRAGARSTR